MVVDDKAKPEILVNNSEIHEFDLKCIDRAGFIPFFTLTKHGQEVYVSSVILFFKYYKKIHCSRLQIKLGLTLKKTKEMIQHRRQVFIEESVSDIQVATPEYAVQQVLKILENEDYVTELLNLKDAVDFEENEETKILYARNKNRLPFVYVNRFNNYNKNFWRRVIPETCKNIDISNYLYSVNDKMMTINGLNFGKAEKVMPLKWGILSNDIVCAFEISNPQRGEYFYDKFICKRVFTTSPFFLNRQNRFEKMDYVLFFSEGIESTLFCVKFVDGMLQTIWDVDILKILHILETTNVFYFLTDNMTLADPQLFAINEESEVSSYNYKKYEMGEEGVLNSTDEANIFTKAKNVSEDDLIIQTQEKEIIEVNNNNLSEDDLIIPTLKNEIIEVNNQLANESNTIKEDEGIFGDLIENLKGNSSDKEFKNQVKNELKGDKRRKSISSRNKVRNFFIWCCIRGS